MMNSVFLLPASSLPAAVPDLPFAALPEPAWAAVFFSLFATLFTPPDGIPGPLASIRAYIR
jgi:hypothetical protein